MNDGTITRVTAACLALAAFSIALIAGLAAGNPTSDILLRALVALACCFILGLAIGLIAERMIGDHIARDAAVSQVESAPAGDARAGPGAPAPIPNVPS